MGRGNVLRGSAAPGDVAAGHHVAVVPGVTVNRDRVRGAGHVAQRGLDRRLTAPGRNKILQQEGREFRGVITRSFVNDNDLTAGGAARGHGDRRLPSVTAEYGKRVDARIVSLVQPQRDLLASSTAGDRSRHRRCWCGGCARRSTRYWRRGRDRDSGCLKGPNREAFKSRDFPVRCACLMESGSDPDVGGTTKLRRVELGDEHPIDREPGRVASNDDFEDIASTLLEAQRRHSATGEIDLQTDLVLPRSIRRYRHPVMVTILLFAEGDAEVPRSISGVAGIDKLDTRDEIFEVGANWHDCGRADRLQEIA